MSKERLENMLASLGKDYEPMREWLEEQPKASVAIQYHNRMLKFLAWVKKNPKQLVKEFTQKEARSNILKFQSFLLGEGYKQNTVRSNINAVRAFYSSQCEEVRKLKHKIVKVQKAIGEHAFDLEDLKGMWSIANTRNKALLAVGVSLGWEASLITEMERSFFEDLVKRAKSKEEDFIAFNWKREKTSAEIYGILTPIAIHSLEAWLKKTEKEPHKKLWNGITQDTLNDVLRSLAKESNVQTIGKIRWHLLGKFLMGALDNAGLTEFQVKCIKGKTIPITDATYLQRLRRNSFKKYKNAYPTMLSLVAFSNNHSKIENLGEAFQIVFKAINKLCEREGLSLEDLGMTPLELNAIKILTTQPKKANQLEG